MGREQKASADLRKDFIGAGFEIVEPGAPPGSISVRKYSCIQFLELKNAQDAVALGPPYFQIRGVNYELEDRGYQKFWYHGGKRIAIRKGDLQTLHRFDQEVRAILHSRSLYNESLGSTCARTVYDRLAGRQD